MKIDYDIEALRSNVISHRRWLHRHPQTGFAETMARDYIMDVLKALEYDEVSNLAKTGVKAVLYGKENGSTIAFRADMDALAIDEKTGLEYASKHSGYMHACGHDGHMAILLGFAQWLSQNRRHLKHNVVLLFQPAEESVGGAMQMISEGALDNPKADYIFGYHIMPEIPQGKIGLKEGPLMAATSEFSIDIYGARAHGAMPHRGIDTILASAHFITQLQSILTRRIDPYSKALVSIGQLQAGDARNIIASHAHMEGTMRTFDEDTLNAVKKHMKELLAGMETSHGIRSEIKEHVYYPPVVNNHELTDRLRGIIPQNMLHTISPMMIAEDFSYYQQRIPGVFIFLGSRDEEKGYTYPLHSDRFQFDEDILLTGIQLYKEILMSL